MNKLGVIERLDAHKSLDEKRLSELHVEVQESHHGNGSEDAADKLGDLREVVVLDGGSDKRPGVLRLYT